MNEKNCKSCDFPCLNNGKNLKPITIEELKALGYVLCDDYTEKYVEEQNVIYISLE